MARKNTKRTQMAEGMLALLGILIEAGEQSGRDTETMIRLWCAGRVELTLVDDETVRVEFLPERPGQGAA